jgi:hypothetical protein
VDWLLVSVTEQPLNPDFQTVLVSRIGLNLALEHNVQ